MSQSTAVAGAPARGWIGRFYQSTIGKKVVMAVTGVVLIGFLIVHVIGNLLVYAGP
jgi:succinate dehydrogenase / fumarate reductase cytochrome b subunit